MKRKNIFVGAAILIILLMMLSSMSALAVDQTWETKASMPTAKTSFQTEVIDRKIYAIGDNSFEVYDPDTNVWTGLASMSTARASFQTEVIDGKIYAIGGHNPDSGVLSSAEVYDLDTNTWTTLASMSTGRDYFRTEVIGRKIYAIGGEDGTKSLSSVEVYDPDTNTWTTLSPMSVARKALQTVVMDGKIYAIGGMSLSSVEVYDPNTDAWTTLAQMANERWYPEVAVIDHDIYVIGGSIGSNNHYSTNSVEAYDSETNTWTTLASMSVERLDCRLSVIDGKIYAVGGRYLTSGGTVYLSSAEVYNPKTNIWTTLPSMSDKRQDLQTKVVGGTIYAMGGTNDSSRLSSVEAYTPNTTSSSAPTLSATAGDKQVNLSWTSIDGAASYHVYRSTTSGGPYTKIETGVTGTTYTDSNVTNGTTYYYVVTAVDSTGVESTYSNEASATPASATPVYSNATLRITMLTGETKEYNVTATVAQDFVAWVNSKASSSPVYAFPKTYDLGPYHARTEYVAYSNISSFEILMY